jgi:hypothetical protein
MRNRCADWPQLGGTAQRAVDEKAVDDGVDAK